MSNEFQPTARLLSIRDAGWIEVGESRVFLCDAARGFFALREQLAREVGGSLDADIFYRAGFASTERLVHYSLANGYLSASAEGLYRALSLLTTGGYGHFAIEEERFRDGWAIVTVRNCMEGWAARENGARAGFVCDYTRGLLRGVMNHLYIAAGYAADMLECAEVGCLANSDPECRFVIGMQSELTARGFRAGDAGQNSVRETLLRLNRQLEEVLEAAQKDSLTGLYNRAHFESELLHRIEFANRRTDALAMAIIDIDRFKEINDTRGHGVGDLALRQVARQLASQARDTDLVARYGGDEFVWLMPGTSMEAAIAVADRIRRRIQESHEIDGLPLTLSIGIASCPDDANSPALLLDLADKAMYRAKREGGNRVRQHLQAGSSGLDPLSEPPVVSLAAAPPANGLVLANVSNAPAPTRRPRTIASKQRRPQITPGKRRRQSGP